jgi:hypothetical protein
MASLISSLKSTVAAKLDRISLLCVVRTAISQELLFTIRIYYPGSSSCDRGREAVFFCLAKLKRETDVFYPIIR